MSVKDNIERIYSELPSAVKLVAVSKFHPVEDIMEAYTAGQRIFGENRPQELSKKALELSAAGYDDIQWHFIGHLQSNKIKTVVPVASLIHSVNSLDLLRKIDLCAASAGKVQDFLFEVHIAREETKQGLSLSEAEVAAKQLADMQREGGMLHVRLRGLMGMATFTDNRIQVESEFSDLESIFLSIRSSSHFPSFDILSMGMSDDWDIAVKHSATHVRIGTSIFGKRSRTAVR